MRTKALVAAAAILAVGALSSMAQSNVYSLNVVGYVNLTLTPGLNLVANQLNNSAGNTIGTTIGTGLPNLTRVYAFDKTTVSYAFLTYNASSQTWVGSAANVALVNAALNPGAGVFISIPGAVNQTVTLVGDVLQGALVNTGVNTAGYAVLSSMVPQAGLLKTDLGYGAANLDRALQWSTGTQNYGSPKTYNASAGTWVGGEPSLGVGEALFIQGHTGSAWTRNFTVQ